MFLLIVPVQVNISVSATTFNVGEDIILTCLIDGYPTPRVVWYKNGQTITNSSNVALTGKHTNIAMLCYCHYYC